VLDAKITVLVVDGYPRWEYRYLVREMARDKTVLISSLLYSADNGAQKDDTKPIGAFPETMQELLAYDCVVFGDVDPRQFTDKELMLVEEFVSKKGGGFGMISGPRWSPYSYRNTPLEPAIPVTLNHLMQDSWDQPITVGFKL